MIPNKVLKRIEKAGGTAMLIGGAVIDRIMSRPVKDWDIEVYGMDLNILIDLLSEFGTPNLVGQSFGVVKIEINGIDFDFSIPRRDNKNGIGHKGFTIECDPTMTPKEAGRRRDLTINSMYLNLHTNELVDPFQGLKDLENGILKATDPRTFVEDPLRVLRIMQLLPRKGKVVDPSTMELCSNMVDTFNDLPKERVFEEWFKLLMKAEKPSMGLNFLRESGWIIHFPELSDLIECEQNPEWHPEGDVWNHTCMVLDNAAQLRNQLPEEWQLAFMFGMLLHDVGKPATTTPDLRSPGHAEKGVEVAKTFMDRITNQTKLTEKVCDIVRLHMRPGDLHRTEAKEKSWKRLQREMRLDVLGFVCKADSAGRTGRSLEDPHGPSEMCWEMSERLGIEPIKPIVQGRDLIAMGLKPGKHFKDILDRCMEMQLDGMTKEEILKNI